MLNVQSRKRSASAGISAQHTVLSVSWMGRSFRALSVHRGQVVGSWESPEPVEGTHNFADLVRKAVEATNHHGDTIALVLSHPRLAHQLAEVPPAKGSALAGLLERAAQQRSGSLFNTKAAWSAQPVESVKGTARYLLNLFPQPLLDEMVNGARQAGMFLTSVLPPTAVLHNQLLELPTKDTEVTMLAADTGGSTTVLVGYSDGRVLLARSLPGNWNDALPTLALDLRRTMLFVNQQHSVDVQSLFLFGPHAAERAAEVQAQVGLPTRASPTALIDDYWALEGLRVQTAAAQNFISRDQQLAPQRRRRAWLAGTLTAVVVLTCVGLTLQLWRMRRTEQQNLDQLRDQTIQLEVQHRELQEQHAEIARRQDLVRFVADDRPAPVPAWALGWLSEAVPRELVVSNLTIRREGPDWQFQLSGAIQPGTPNPGGAAMQTALSTLTNRLVTGPLRVQLAGTATTNTPPGTVGLVPSTPVGISWLERLRSTQPQAVVPEQGFFIEGWILP